MIRAVLFDLDGTLLDIDLDAFLSAYFDALGPVLAELTGLGRRRSLGALSEATDAMMRPHSGLTNQQAFERRFEELTGVRLDEPAALAAVGDFYERRFPSLRATHGPRQGAAEAVAAARDAGLRLALATNPIFPRAAIIERLRWTGIDAASFEVVTSYETARAVKPSPEYFLAIAEELAVDPVECLMVGDDATLDLPAADVGMAVFHVGDGGGSLTDVRDLLVRQVR